jgi:hypothetical protein
MVTIGKQNGFAAAKVIGRRCAYVKPADENVMHTQKDFDRDVYKNPYLKVAGISTRRDQQRPRGDIAARQ